MNNKIWFVTGASKGLGLALVKKLLSNGNKVAATSRNKKDLEAAVGDRSENFLPLVVDINNEESVGKAIDSTVSHFGGIDIVVNNAGYGLAGALEELSDEEARKNFDVNVFGSLNVIRNAAPYLRKQGSGHIMNVSSIGGFTGAFPGFGIYCATKFAVQGFSESLREELKPFNVLVTAVSPGYFRTNFLENDSLIVSKKQMKEYENVRSVQTLHQESIAGNQPGDPDKAADVLINIAGKPNAPMHLILGADAYKLAKDKIEAITKDMNDFAKLATATDFS